MSFEYKEALTETTGEVDGFTYPPHTYYLNNAGKMVAFKSSFTDELKIFNKPLLFDKRRRKFTKEKK